MKSNYDVLIVGTGHAGTQCAIALRQLGFSGSIGMLGRELDPPYERPPLSKEYLLREKDFDRLLIRPLSHWDKKDVDLLLGREVTEVDADQKSVTLNGEDAVSYGTLVWAGGGVARRLSCDGSDLRGIHYVRTRADVDNILRDIEGGADRAVVVGGGYIGLEAASGLRKLNCNVVLIEALPRLLARVAGEEISDFIARKHISYGVDLRLSTTIQKFEGHGERISHAHLSTGEQIDCELLIAGIGIVPDVAPLISAGAHVSNGIAVDQFCQTSLSSIYAIGDCAEHQNSFAGGQRVRLESVQNANDMAVTASKHICGEADPYTATPWFWSNQYDIKLQTVGLSTGADRTVLRGDLSEGKFSVIYLQGGKVIALDCVNSARDYVQGRKLVEAQATIDATDLADCTRPLKSMLAS